MRTLAQINADLARWTATADEASRGVLATTGERRERHYQLLDSARKVLSALRDERDMLEIDAVFDLADVDAWDIAERRASLATDAGLLSVTATAPIGSPDHTAALREYCRRHHSDAQHEDRN